MEWFHKMKLLAVAVVLFGTLSACSFGPRTGQADERDPHYLEGESREASKDNAGAVEAYLRAIENNPRNAAAHKRLGFIYSQNPEEQDSAIYHFKKLLQLRPADPHEDLIREHITRSRQKLAQAVAVGPLTRQTQEELLRLKDENTRLQKMVAGLTQQVLQLQKSPPIQPSPTNIPSIALAPAQNVSGPLSPSPQTFSNATVTPVPNSGISSRNPGSAQTKPSANRAVRDTTQVGATNAPVKSSGAARAATTTTHKVKAGETFGSIAKQKGLSPRALILANPNVDPRRLKAGQIIFIPEH